MPLIIGRVTAVHGAAPPATVRESLGILEALRDQIRPPGCRGGHRFRVWVGMDGILMAASYIRPNTPSNPPPWDQPVTVNVWECLRVRLSFQAVSGKGVSAMRAATFLRSQECRSGGVFFLANIRGECWRRRGEICQLPNPK